MDIVDKAQIKLEQDLKDAIENRQQYSGESAHVCVECDDEIPDARREAVPGVQLCIHCQSNKEIWR